MRLRASVLLIAVAAAVAASSPMTAQTTRGSATDRAPVIRPGQTTRGTLTDDDVELFDDAPAARWRIAGHRGDHLRIRMASADFEPFVSLIRHAGGRDVVVAYRSAARATTGALIDATLPADGEYVIEATVLEPDARGAYQLTIEPARR